MGQFFGLLRDDDEGFMIPPKTRESEGVTFYLRAKLRKSMNHKMSVRGGMEEGREWWH